MAEMMWTRKTDEVRAVKWTGANIDEVREVYPGLGEEYMRDKGCGVGYYVISPHPGRVYFMHEGDFESQYSPTPAVTEAMPERPNIQANFYNTVPGSEFKRYVDAMEALVRAERAKNSELEANLDGAGYILGKVCVYGTLEAGEHPVNAPNHAAVRSILTQIARAEAAEAQLAEALANPKVGDCGICGATIWRNQGSIDNGEGVFHITCATVKSQLAEAEARGKAEGIKAAAEVAASRYDANYRSGFTAQAREDSVIESAILALIPKTEDGGQTGESA